MKRLAITILITLLTTVSPQAICSASCDTCSGSGYCHVCDGSGVASGGGTCIICSGSTKCYVCSGSGKF